MLRNPERTACKEALIGFLRRCCRDIDALNRAWNSSLESFDSLYRPRDKVSKWSEALGKDMRKFSRRMLRV